MPIYPQLATGALCQFPVQKTRRSRTVVNRSADGSTIKLADPASEITEWQLDYCDLSDGEIAALRDFFVAVEGTLTGFTFLDPTGNLLSSNNQLDAQVWQKDPMLTVTADTGMWHLANSGAAGQAIWQTIQAPGEYRYCLSAYVRAASTGDAGLIIGTQTLHRPVSSTWTRIAASAVGEAGAESVRFGLEAPAGITLDVYGLQVEAQGAASSLKPSTRGGVYADAHLATDELKITCTGVNRNSCTVHVIHANRI
jgi:hypothetical protein